MRYKQGKLILEKAKINQIITKKRKWVYAVKKVAKRKAVIAKMFLFWQYAGSLSSWTWLNSLQRAFCSSVVERPKYSSQGRRFVSYWKHSEFFFSEYARVIHWITSYFNTILAEKTTEWRQSLIIWLLLLPQSSKEVDPFAIVVSPFGHCLHCVAPYWSW